MYIVYIDRFYIFYSKYKANYSNLSMEFPEQIVVREQIFKKVPQLFLKYKNKCKDY